MAKFRSPVLGFNHNIRHNGWLFHVQTEDSGIQSPHLNTHLFHEGVIVASKRLDYDPEADVEVVKTLMQAQHKAVMKELKNGVYDDKIKLYFGDKVEKTAADEPSAPIEIIDDPSAATLLDPPPAAAANEPTPVAVAEKTEVTPQPPGLAAAITDEAAATLPMGSRDGAGNSSPYEQLVVDKEAGDDDAPRAVVSGVLDAREPDIDDDDEINGLLSRLKEDSVNEPLPGADTEKAGTWIVSRPGQKERPFEKTGPVAVPLPVQREEVARRVVGRPPHLPEVSPPPVPGSRSRKMTLPQQVPGTGAPSPPRRPTPPPTQVNPVGAPPSGQYSTVKPARPSSQVQAARPPSGTNPPVGPKPPTIPPVRPQTPPPVASVSRPPTSPPRIPSQGLPPAAARPPLPPGRSQGAAPVPPSARPGGVTPPPRPPVQVGAPQRPQQPVTTTPMRAQTVVAPTGMPSRPPAIPARGTPPARPAPAISTSPVPGRRPPASEGVVVARPAVVIGAPPTVIGGPAGESSPTGRRIHGREPTPPPIQPESIFGQDLISEKSLDEVIMAYLSEDSNED